MTKDKAKKEEREWDKYWTKKKTKSQAVYRIIAGLYRNLVIKKTLNFFIEKEFKAGSKLLHAGSGAGQVDNDIIKKFDITALDISLEALKLYKFYNGKNAASRFLEPPHFKALCIFTLFHILDYATEF